MFLIIPMQMRVCTFKRNKSVTEILLLFYLVYQSSRPLSRFQSNTMADDNGEKCLSETHNIEEQLSEPTKENQNSQPDAELDELLDSK